ARASPEPRARRRAGAPSPLRREPRMPPPGGPAACCFDLSPTSLSPREKSCIIAVGSRQEQSKRARRSRDEKLTLRVSSLKSAHANDFPRSVDPESGCRASILGVYEAHFAPRCNEGAARDGPARDTRRRRQALRRWPRIGRRGGEG